MVGIDTHRMADLPASREVEDVAEWLRSYPNIQIVSREGSVSHKSAIEQAGMDIQQASDHFHLLKGLTDAAKKFIPRLLSANFTLPTEASHYGGELTGDYWDKPIKEDSPTAEHNANVEKKMKVVEQVRELRKQGFNKGEIAGSDAAIRMFATRERKVMKESARQGGSGEKIERKWLVSLLYRPIDKIASISAEQLGRIIGEHPAIGRVYDAVSGFKQTLLGKKESELDKWLEETDSLEIDELSSFANGIRGGIAAVKMQFCLIIIMDLRREA